jgi:serine protease inhibitor
MTDTGAAVSGLTAAWLRALPLDEDTVVSGAGLWPLIGLLAGAADGPARAELSAAVGMDADVAARDAGELLATLDASPDIAAASGTWVRPGVPLAAWWRDHVPADSIGELVSQEALDAWARERTDGLIEQMPVQLGPQVRLLLATALLLRTTWRAPFREIGHDGRTLLNRSTGGVEDVAVHSGGTTVVSVRGEQDVDVFLAIGAADAAPADVLTALLTGEVTATGDDLLARSDATPAPALTVRTVTGHAPRTELTLPAFEVRRTHDLLRHADVFGLRSAAADGGFPRLSAQPLRVDQAAQQVLARFFATGFEAAAVTSVGMRASAMSRPGQTRVVTVRLDRPFGFAALHRPTEVPVVAGWIADVPEF